MGSANGSQSELHCPNCAGQYSYSPKQRGLQCASCGDVHDLRTDQDHKAAEEVGYDPKLATEDLPDFSEIRAHYCNTCGGDVLFTGQALSERCPYCDGSVVLSSQDAGY